MFMSNTVMGNVYSTGVTLGAMVVGSAFFGAFANKRPNNHWSVIIKDMLPNPGNESSSNPHWKLGITVSLITGVVEVTLIKLLNNPPLDFTGMITVRAISVILVTLATQVHKPNNERAKAALISALAASVAVIAIRMIYVSLSEDPTALIAKDGVAFDPHNFLEALDILRRTELAAG
jgi:hypothetical protein